MHFEAAFGAAERFIDLQLTRVGAERSVGLRALSAVSLQNSDPSSPQSRHPRQRLPGAPDTIRTCDHCPSGLAPYPISPLQAVADSAR